ncbi:MAG: hypothetical protein QM767_27240, partial [Anaeromyxobacter sp.]
MTFTQRGIRPGAQLQVGGGPGRLGQDLGQARRGGGAGQRRGGGRGRRGQQVQGGAARGGGEVAKQGAIGLGGAGGGHHRHVAGGGQRLAQRREAVAHHDPERVVRVGQRSAAQVERGQGGAAVGRRGAERGQEPGPVPGGEGPRRLGPVAEDHQVHRGAGPGGEQRVEESQLARGGGGVPAAGGVPGQRQALRGGRDGGLRRLRGALRQREEGPLAALLQRQPAGRQPRQVHQQVARGRGLLQPLLRHPAIAGLGQRQVAEPAHRHRRDRRADHLDPQRHLGQRLAVGEGQVVGGLVTLGDERGDPAQPDGARAAGGDGVDAGAVDVAPHLLHQPGVDALADLGLQNDPRLLAGHHRPVHQLAVHVEREAGHGGAVRQRELQLALQHPRVGVREGEGLGGLGGEALDDHPHVQRPQRHRLLGGADGQARRGQHLGGRGAGQGEEDGQQQGEAGQLGEAGHRVPRGAVVMRGGTHGRGRGSHRQGSRASGFRPQE